MPRVAHKPTEESRKTVMAMSGYGIAQADICKVVGSTGISIQTMHKYYRQEIDTGHIIANAKVAASLWKQATEGNTVAGIWWSKTRMGWKETRREEHTGADGGPIEVVDDKELARRAMVLLGVKELR